MLHYYGDLVRRLFFAGAFIMLATSPFFKDLLPLPIFLPATIVIILTLIAAITNPTSRRIAILNVIVSACAVIFFEYYAIQTLYTPSWDLTTTAYFWTNHILALDFIFALYYSSKTFRGMMVKEQP